MKLITKPTSILGAAAIAFAALLPSCSSDSSADVEVVDLDVVLAKFESAAKAMPAVEEADVDNDAKIPSFVAAYTKELNDAKLMKDPVGVAHIASDGSFLGFKDSNKNGKKDAGDTDLFKVEVFQEENKLIASDLVHREYRRDRHFSGTGFIAGYLMSRMMFGQRRGGITSSRFRGMKMSKSGYHKSAVSSKTSAAKAKSARSSSGSKSFRSGK